MDQRPHAGFRFRQGIVMLSLWIVGMLQGAGATTFFETTNATWRLFRGTSEASSPVAQWRQLNFNDSAWENAPAPLLYTTAATEPPFFNGGVFTGTSLAGMQNSYTCLFLRKTFVLSNPGAVSTLHLDLAVDDGCIVWINGVEVVRTNVAPGTPIYSATASTSVGEPSPVMSFAIPNVGGLLVTGTNILAVQGFNSAIGSSDFGFMAGLSSEVDAQAPFVAGLLPPGGSTLGDLSQIEVTFNEAVTQVQASDLLVNGIPATGLVTISPTQQRFTFAQPTAGAVSISWAPGHGIADLAGNPFPGGAWGYTLDLNTTSPAAVISEFMAANLKTTTDEDGDFSDWIEILNPRFASLNLGGWSLTDDAGDLKKWTFPATNLPPGGRLLVFASGKDRRVPGAPLHASFVLSATGGFVGLASPDGELVSSFRDYPRQQSDVSYGIVGNTGTNGYLAAATPGAANVGETVEFVEEVRFSHEHGFHWTPFDLVLSCGTPGATIYYTTNGTIPGAGNGQVYAGPIPIGATKTLRARAERAGARSSRTGTRTYLFLADVVNQSAAGNPPPGWPATWGANVVDYGMDPDIVGRAPWAARMTNDLRAVPTLSIVMKVEDLFDAQSGIYANAGGEGENWERQASVELIRPDGKKGFQIDGGIRIRGGFSRSSDNPKHSFRILFRSSYGESRLRYPLFGETGAEDFDRFDLRTSQDNSYAYQGDPGGTFVVDSFVRETFLATGQQGERGNWYHLYLNGQYWGIYNSCERPEANFAASYFGGVPEDYDVLKPDPQLGYVMKVTDGDDGAWRRLWQAAVDGFAGNTAYYRVQGRNPDGSPNPALENLLDVANLIDYMLTIIYVGDEDGPMYGDLNDGFLNNYYAFRSRKNTSGFRFATHDAELSLRSLYSNRAGTSTRGSPTRGDGPQHCNPHYLLTRLRANAEFKMLFADRVQQLFFDGGPMTPGPAIARFQRLTNELHDAVTGESARWGDAKRPTSPITRNDWINAVTDLQQGYFPYRTDIVLDQLRDEGLFPLVTAPRTSPAPGLVDFGTAVTLTSSNSSGQIYYTLDGTDPRAPGGGLASGALGYNSPILVQGSLRVRARVRNGTTWSPLLDATYYPAQDLGGVRFTEISYHPQVPGATNVDEYEFIELQNTGVAAVDLGGATFSGVTFTFTNGTVLGPGAFFVLARDAARFSSRYPGVPVNGVFGGKLANTGENLVLRTAWGGLIASVHYTDRTPWPAAADGHGFTIVPRDPGSAVDPEDGAAWRASTNPGGSPGAADPAPGVPTLFINEVLTHTDLPLLDAIELHNPNSVAVDPEGWFLTDDPAVPRKFRVPAGRTIPAGGYQVFDESDFNPGGTGFALDSTGDEVYLFSGNAAGTNLTGYSHGVVVGASANGVTFGRWINSAGEEQFPAQQNRTLGATNSGPRVGPVVLNEIHYHPSSNEFPFVELLNITSSPVQLFDPANPTNAWRVNGIDFSFPPNTILPANGLALIVGGDPAVFRARHGLPLSVAVFGPFSGSLQRDGERLELQRPDTPNTNLVPYVTVDSVRYRDRPPWAVAADGGNSSLQRLVASGYGDDPANWFASGLTPGAANRPTLGPPILEQPESQSVTPGTTVTFNVSALGEAIHYQWQFNAVDLPGATNASLVLPAVVLSQAGGYRVVLTNASGSSTSATAILSVNCSYSLLGSPTNFPSQGGIGTIEVQTAGGCDWTITGIPSWVQVLGPAGGNGPATVSFQVHSNTARTLRSAILRLGGSSLVLMQSPPDSIRPTLTFLGPAANTRLSSAVVRVHGRAADNIALDRVECQVNDGNFRPVAGTVVWEDQVTLRAGTNRIRVRALDLQGNVSAIAEHGVFLVVPAPLSLATTGGGRVTGATNGQSLEIGRAYTLTAVPPRGSIFSNWNGTLASGSPRITFLMESNLALTANFVTNPFPAVTGDYNGLLHEADRVRHAHSGFFTFTLSDRGTYSARVTVGSERWSASGKLTAGGQGTNTLPRHGANLLAITWNVLMDGSDEITGTLTGEGWSAALHGDRAIHDTRTMPYPSPGTFTFILPGASDGTNAPVGDGFGTMKIDGRGKITATARLPDKAVATQRVPISRRGEWPFHLPLYGSKGSILAWIAVTNGTGVNLQGDLSWSRPALARAPLYPDGFERMTRLTGSRYEPPTNAAGRVIEISAGGMEFTGGNLTGTLTNLFTLGPGSRLTNGGPGLLGCAFLRSSGLFSGSFTPAGTARRIAFQGVVLQGLATGSGYFVDTNQSGRVTLR